MPDFLEPTPPAMHLETLEHARRMVRDAGARVTPARVRVLAELLESDEALTHQAMRRRVEAADAGPVLDRVTVYRVLDWLVDSGLAHRVAGPDRVYRFGARGEGPGSAVHGHFRCTACDRMFCMRDGSAMGRWVRAMLPAGCTGEEIELTVSGCCAACATPRRHETTGATDGREEG
jgi:Fur family ferric uptake transcriptional regulator